MVRFHAPYGRSGSGMLPGAIVRAPGGGPLSYAAGARATATSPRWCVLPGCRRSHAMRAARASDASLPDGAGVPASDAPATDPAPSSPAERRGPGLAHCAAAVAAAVAALAAGCGGTNPTTAAPPAHSIAERQWIANASSFIGTLNSDVLVSTVGGGNLATARRVLRNQSDVYSLLVAYDLFGDCTSALANAGTPSQRAGAVDQTLISVCGRLERASALFSRAMSKTDAASLLAATRTVLTVVPLLTRARAELSGLK